MSFIYLKLICLDLRNQSEIKQTDINDQDMQPENIYVCQSRPLYGCDVLSQIELAMRPCHRLNRTTFSGYTLCQWIPPTSNTTRDYFTTTDILRRLVKSNRDLLDEYQDILNRYINK